jgi:hypothetical protein
LRQAFLWPAVAAPRQVMALPSLRTKLSVRVAVRRRPAMLREVASQAR